MNLNLCTYQNVKFVIQNEYAKWTGKERRRKTAEKYKMGTVKGCVNQIFFLLLTTEQHFIHQKLALKKKKEYKYREKKEFDFIRITIS